MVLTARSDAQTTSTGDLAGFRQRYYLARQCADCHLEHFREWSASFHALSLRTEGFLQGFARFVVAMEAQGRRGRNVYMACLGCHAPLLEAAADRVVHDVAQVVLTREVQQLEGLEVGCVACHRGEGEVFHGPITDPVANPFHASAYSHVYESAQACAGCHTWSPSAVACSTVYTDWQGSQAALEGRTCQACHMPEQRGAAAHGGPARTTHSHAFPGGRSSALLGQAVELGLDAAWEQNQLLVTVVVKNFAAHRLPDG